MLRRKKWVERKDHKVIRLVGVLVEWRQESCRLEIKPAIGSCVLGGERVREKERARACQLCGIWKFFFTKVAPAQATVSSPHRSHFVVRLGSHDSQLVKGGSASSGGHLACCAIAFPLAGSRGWLGSLATDVSASASQKKARRVLAVHCSSTIHGGLSFSYSLRLGRASDDYSVPYVISQWRPTPGPATRVRRPCLLLICGRCVATSHAGCPLQGKTKTYWRKLSPLRAMRCLSPVTSSIAISLRWGWRDGCQMQNAPGSSSCAVAPFGIESNTSYVIDDRHCRFYWVECHIGPVVVERCFESG